MAIRRGLQTAPSVDDGAEVDDLPLMALAIAAAEHRARPGGTGPVLTMWHVDERRAGARDRPPIAKDVVQLREIVSHEAEPCTRQTQVSRYRMVEAKVVWPRRDTPPIEFGFGRPSSGPSSAPPVVEIVELPVLCRRPASPKAYEISVWTVSAPARRTPVSRTFWTRWTYSL